MNNLKDRIHFMALQNEKEGGIPAAAIITWNGKIIASAVDECHLFPNPIRHAEIIALHDAHQSLRQRSLREATLYVVTPPCHFCKAAIELSGIHHIVLPLNDIPKNANN